MHATTRLLSLAPLAALGVLAARSALAEPFAYVANMAAETVLVVDTAANDVVATIDVEGEPWSLAVSPDGARVYVTYSNGTISVIDAGTNQVIAPPIVVAAGGRSTVTVGPDGAQVYVLNNGGALYVIDAVSNSVIDGPIDADGHVPGFGSGVSIVLSPDGAQAYALNSAGYVTRIDLGDRQIIGEPAYCGAVAAATNDALAVHPDGSRVYAAINRSWICVVDAETQEAEQIPLALPPEARTIDLAVTPDGKRLYVTTYDDNVDPAVASVFVIDTATNSVIAGPIDVGSLTPVSVAVTPDGSRVYVTTYQTTPLVHELWVIDTATNSLIGDPISGAGGTGIAIGPGPDVSALVSDPANPLTIYAGTAGAGMYRSTDGGTSWAPINTGLTAYDVTALAMTSDGSAVYAGTRTGGIFKTLDGGASWVAMNNGLDTRIRSLHIAPNDDQTIYAGVAAGGGVYKSVDGGANWTAINDGLPDATAP